MKKILLMAILFLSFQLQAKELASVTVGDQKVLQVRVFSRAYASI